MTKEPCTHRYTVVIFPNDSPAEVRCADCDSRIAGVTVVYPSIAEMDKIFNQPMIIAGHITS